MNLLDTPPADAAAAGAAPPEQVVGSIDDLIVGRPLRFPVHDENNGLLLLGAGQILTAEFKQRLRQFGIEKIRFDAREASTRSLAPTAVAPVSALTGNTRLLDQLDRVVEKGFFQVKNLGPPVRDSVRRHGAAAYDGGRRERLQEKHAAAHSTLSEIMRNAVSGKCADASKVTEVAADFLAQIAEDADCVMSVALASTKHPDLTHHALQMALLAMAVGVEMGLDEENCRRLCVCGLVCDWGMFRLPPELREEPRILSELEHFELRKHPIYTAEILEKTPGLPSLVTLIAYQVHERPNGKGYPKQRGSDRIHLLAKILAAADTYTAMTSPKPYRPPLSPYSAVELVVRLARLRDLDPEVVRALLRVLSLFPIGSLVALSDGSVGQVIRRNGDNYAQPIVQLVQDAAGNNLPADAEPVVIDLSAGGLSVAQALSTPGRGEMTQVDEWLILDRPPR